MTDEELLARALVSGAVSYNDALAMLRRHRAEIERLTRETGRHCPLDVVEGAREIAAQNEKYAWAVPGGFELNRKWLEQAIAAFATACVARARAALADKEKP